MKKAIPTGIIFFILLFSIAPSMEFLEIAKANPVIYPEPFPLYVYFNSPLNTTYYSNSIILNFSILKIYDCNDTVRKAWYSLNGQESVPVLLVYEGMSSHNGNALLHSDVSGVADLPQLSDGTHNITVYEKYTYYNYTSYTLTQESDVTATFVIMTNSTPQPNTPSPSPTFTLSPTPMPTSSPTMTASLPESASALNYGNKINLTVTVDGGVPPYTFAWYVDGQLAETSASQYYSTNTLQVGSHQVNVQVIDANNNRATTLGVAFEVLIALSPSSSTPTQQPTSSPGIVSIWGNNIVLYSIAVVVIVVVVLLVIFLLRRK